MKLENPIDISPLAIDIPTGIESTEVKTNKTLIIVVVVVAIIIGGYFLMKKIRKNDTD